MSAVVYKRMASVGPRWRVWPDVAAHWLSDHRVIPARWQRAACRLRGTHRFRYTF